MWISLGLLVFNLKDIYIYIYILSSHFGYGLSIFINGSGLLSFLIEIIILEVAVLLFSIILGCCSFSMEFLRGTFLFGSSFGWSYGR